MYEGTLNVLASGELRQLVADIRATGFVLAGTAVAGAMIRPALPVSSRPPGSPIPPQPQTRPRTTA